MLCGLHSHTTASDGQYIHILSRLVKLAKRQGLLAVTDHDTIAGVDEAQRVGYALGLYVIRGIEQSTRERGNFHILGYGFRDKGMELSHLCVKLRAGRGRGHRPASFCPGAGEMQVCCHQPGGIRPLSGYGSVPAKGDAVQGERFRILVVKSSIPPATTQRQIIPFVQSQGKRVSEQIGIANNLEFLREGHCWENFIHADHIVLGISDHKSETMLRELYQEAGEFIKYLSN